MASQVRAPLVGANEPAPAGGAIGRRTTATRRRFASSALATLAPGAVLLAACGAGGGADQAAAPARPSAAPVTLESYHEWEGVRLALAEEMAADFMAAHPNITVKLTLSRGNISMDKILASIAGGSPPDVVMILTHTGALWSTKNALRSLDDRLKRDKITPEQVFYKATTDLCQRNGHYFGLPTLVAGVDSVLMYNREVFKQFGLDPAKPPRTWEEAEAVSTKVTERQGSQLTRIGLVPSNRGFWEWLYLDDGRLFSPDGTKVAFNGPQGQEAMTFLSDIVQRLYGGIGAVNDFYNANRAPGPTRGPRLPWYTGKEVLWVDLVASFFYIDGEEPGFPLGAAQPPYNAKNPKAKAATVAERTWIYSLPQGGQENDGVWTWFSYITMGEGIKKLLLAQKRPSPVRKHTEDKVYRDLNPHWDVVLKNLDSAISVPQTPAWEDIRNTLDTATKNVLNQKMSVRQALDQAADESQQLLDQFRT